MNANRTRNTEGMGNQQIYSCRAELDADVPPFAHEIRLRDSSADLREFAFRDRTHGVAVEIATTLPPEEVLAAARSVEDGHYMVQTMRACALVDNPLERSCALGSAA